MNGNQRECSNLIQGCYIRETMARTIGVQVYHEFWHPLEFYEYLVYYDENQSGIFRAIVNPIPVKFLVQK